MSCTFSVVVLGWIRVLLFGLNELAADCLTEQLTRCERTNMKSWLSVDSAWRETRTRFTLVAAELVTAETEHESEVRVHLVPVSAALVWREWGSWLFPPQRGLNDSELVSNVDLRAVGAEVEARGSRGVKETWRRSDEQEFSFPNNMVAGCCSQFISGCLFIAALMRSRAS